MRHTIGAMVAMVLAMAGVTPVEAQSLGTFRWQLQPYCNVVTVQVEQRGAVYTLDGFDDQCGAAQRVTVVGLATPNPDGSIGFGLHLVAPGGRALDVQARITLAALGGTWSDSSGDSGTFTFGTSTGGPVRSFSVTGLPRQSITGIEVAPGAITTSHVTDGSLLSTDLRDGPRSAFASSDQAVAVSTPVIVRRAAVVAPGPGRVLVTASGVMQFTNTGAVQETGWCYFSVNGTHDLSYLITADDDASTLASRLVPFASTFGLNVTAPGIVAIDLMCEEPFPATTNLWIRDTGLTVLYVAQ